MTAIPIFEDDAFVDACALAAPKMASYRQDLYVIVGYQLRRFRAFHAPYSKAAIEVILERAEYVFVHNDALYAGTGRTLWLLA